MTPPVGVPDADFARTMDRLGPFEPHPHLAVAASGGPDSTALLLLAAAWAAARGGRVTALTVDHGLRPEAAGEAEAVARLAAELGAGHAILPWRPDKGPPPAGDAENGNGNGNGR